VRPAPTARTLVRAFFGLCTLTEALEGPQNITHRLTDSGHLTLPSLQQGDDPAETVGRARAEVMSEAGGPQSHRVTAAPARAEERALPGTARARAGTGAAVSRVVTVPTHYRATAVHRLTATARDPRRTRDGRGDRR
jgi:hypothetical protein